MLARAAKSKAKRDTLSWSRTPELAKLVLSQGNKCGYCSAQMADATVDHKQPVSRGGDDSFDNLVACCSRCNINKRDKTEAEYRSFLDRVGGWGLGGVDLQPKSPTDRVVGIEIDPPSALHPNNHRHQGWRCYRSRTAWSRA